VDTLSADHAVGLYRQLLWRGRGGQSARHPGRILFSRFKRVEDRGTYQTPLGVPRKLKFCAAAFAVLRRGQGGRAGQFIPKSESGENAALNGDVSATYGSYSKRNLSGQIGLPLDLGFASGGIHAYGEIDDSFQLLSRVASQPPDAGIVGRFRGGRLDALGDYMFYHSNGDGADAGLETG